LIEAKDEGCCRDAAALCGSMGERLMKYVLIVLGILIFFMVQYRIELKKKEKQMRAKIRREWGTYADRQFTAEELYLVASYYRQQEAGFTIDDITWHDLSMDEVFTALNRTYSSVGEEYLYYVLRTPSFSGDELRERARVADVFIRQEKDREDVAFLLSSIGKNYRNPFTEYVVRLMDLREQSNVFHISVLLMIIVAAVLAFTVSEIGLPLLFGALVFSIVTYYKTKGEVEPYFTCIQKILRLSDAGRKISALSIPALSDYLEELGKLSGLIRKKSALVGLMQTGSAMNGSLADMVLDYLRMATHIDLIVFNQINRGFKHHQEDIFRLIELIGRLELGLLIASFRSGQRISCEPELSGTHPRLKAENMVHPLISDPVPNSIESDEHVLLTGSNASGKSTFLKTVAINSILAQTIYTVTATAWRSPWFRVYSSMALADNLFEGESYFIVEIKSLKRIIDRIDENDYPVLCFVDEVLRGTNTVERIAASAQILKGFSGRNALCFAATHDIELTTLLAPYYANYHFTETVRENDVYFPYLLKNGPATSRNAIRLLGVMGYDKELTGKAEETAKRFLESGKWAL